ncbi:DUF1697 domain-containing protein [Tenacibaculum aquimarinum]|uniref:DUF1697 domain-containing protein n=1 Tax=Tenacibaculum aquimarinum TaxID=2910675 RepID=UPI001F0AD6B0|nr:DUF1697 domain-containing protein [Tenacibaculum aquimarinum]MCH3884344.1 DUF1697 domain-containing protein [Tenacibaculum aquimarinum]
MKKYIVLLRGINVSGKNKLPMAELRNLLNDLGFKNVQTYIQSGNIILESEKLKSEICKIIKNGILDKFGYDVPLIARTIPEWKKVIESYPFSTENEKIVAFSFLNKVPEETIIEIKNIGEDKYKVANDVVYLNCPSGFGKTKLTNNNIEKKLKVIATTRNLRTTLKLLELAK